MTKPQGRPSKGGTGRTLSFRIGEMAAEFEELVVRAYDVYCARAVIVDMPKPSLSNMYRSAMIHGLKAIIASAKEWGVGE